MKIDKLSGLFLALALGSAQAAMYKWTTADGSVQFGDFPPPGVDATYISGPRTPLPDTEDEATQSGNATRDVVERARALDARKQSEAERAAAAKEKQEREAEQARQCENAHRTVELLSRGGNRRYQLPDGSIRRFDEAETQRRIQQSRDYIRENCS
ncbi:MAG TPA: DUF4124 domain-containing protein [Gammaproteobacteria bacterium]|nr:DUF4124 domain-containing protein [Gammaproteobacteria bacterium]